MPISNIYGLKGLSQKDYEEWEKKYANELRYVGLETKKEWFIRYNASKNLPKDQLKDYDLGKTSQSLLISSYNGVYDKNHPANLSSQAAEQLAQAQQERKKQQLLELAAAAEAKEKQAAELAAAEAKKKEEAIAAEEAKKREAANQAVSQAASLQNGKSAEDSLKELAKKIKQEEDKSPLQKAREEDEKALNSLLNNDSALLSISSTAIDSANTKLNLQSWDAMAIDYALSPRENLMERPKPKDLTKLALMNSLRIIADSDATRVHGPIDLMPDLHGHRISNARIKQLLELHPEQKLKLLLEVKGLVSSNLMYRRYSHTYLKDMDNAQYEELLYKYLSERDRLLQAVNSGDMFQRDADRRLHSFFTDAIETEAAKKAGAVGNYGNALGGFTTSVYSGVMGLVGIVTYATPLGDIVDLGYDASTKLGITEGSYKRKPNEDIGGIAGAIDRMLDNPITRHADAVQNAGLGVELTGDNDAVKDTDLSAYYIPVNHDDYSVGNFFSEVLPRALNQGGYTVASILEGKALSSIATKVTKGAVKGIAKAAKVERIADTVEKLKKIRLIVTIGKKVEKFNNRFIVPALVGSGEGAIEGLQVKKEVQLLGMQEVDNYFNLNELKQAEWGQKTAETLLNLNATTAILNKISEQQLTPIEEIIEKYKLLYGEDSAMVALIKDYYKENDADYQQALREVDYAATLAGVDNFVANSLINGALNVTIQNTLLHPSTQSAIRDFRFSSLIPNAVSNSRAVRAIGSAASNVGKQTSKATKRISKKLNDWHITSKPLEVTPERVVTAGTPTYLESFYHIIREPLGEGFEEYEQELSSSVTKEQGNKHIQHYLELLNDPTKSADKLIGTRFYAGFGTVTGDALGTLKETAVSAEAWKAAFYGALGSVIGTPGGIHKSQRVVRDENGDMVLDESGKVVTESTFLSERQSGESKLHHVFRDASRLTPWRSGITAGFRYRSAMALRNRDAASAIEDWLKEDRTRIELLSGIRGGLNITEAQALLSKQGNTKEFRDTELGLTVNTILMLDRLKGTLMYDSIMLTLDEIENFNSLTDKQKETILSRERARGFNETDELIVQRLLKNVKEVRESIDKVAKIKDDLSSVTGEDLDNDAYTALVYGLLAVEDWEKRNKKIQEELDLISNSESVSRGAIRSTLTDELKSAIATYGSIANLRESKEKYESQLANLKEQLAEVKQKIQEKEQSEDGFLLSDTERKKLDILNSKIKDTKALIEACDSALSLILGIDKDGELGENPTNDVLSAKEILALPAHQRAIMLNPENLSYYSSAQQGVITDLIQKATLQDASFMTKILDSAMINDSIESTLKEYNNILENLDDFNDYIASLNLTRKAYYRRKSYEAIAEIEDYEEFVKAINNLYSNNVGNINSSLLHNILKRYSNEFYNRWRESNEGINDMVDTIGSNEAFADMDTLDKSKLAAIFEFLKEKGVDITDDAAVEAALSSLVELEQEDGESLEEPSNESVDNVATSPQEEEETPDDEQLSTYEMKSSYQEDDKVYAIGDNGTVVEGIVTSPFINPLTGKLAFTVIWDKSVGGVYIDSQTPESINQMMQQALTIGQLQEGEAVEDNDAISFGKNHQFTHFVESFNEQYAEEDRIVLQLGDLARMLSLFKLVRDTTQLEKAKKAQAIETAAPITTDVGIFENPEVEDDHSEEAPEEVVEEPAGDPLELEDESSEENDDAAPEIPKEIEDLNETYGSLIEEINNLEDESEKIRRVLEINDSLNESGSEFSLQLNSETNTYSFIEKEGIDGLKDEDEEADVLDIFGEELDDESSDNTEDEAPTNKSEEDEAKELINKEDNIIDSEEPVESNSDSTIVEETPVEGPTTSGIITNEEIPELLAQGAPEEGSVFNAFPGASSVDMTITDASSTSSMTYSNEESSSIYTSDRSDSIENTEEEDTGSEEFASRDKALELHLEHLDVIDRITLGIDSRDFSQYASLMLTLNDLNVELAKEGYEAKLYSNDEGKAEISITKRETATSVETEASTDEVSIDEETGAIIEEEEKSTEENTPYRLPTYTAVSSNESSSSYTTTVDTSFWNYDESSIEESLEEPEEFTDTTSEADAETSKTETEENSDEVTGEEIAREAAYLIVEEDELLDLPEDIYNLEDDENESANEETEEEAVENPTSTSAVTEETPSLNEEDELLELPQELRDTITGIAEKISQGLKLIDDNYDIPLSEAIAPILDSINKQLAAHALSVNQVYSKEAIQLAAEAVRKVIEESTQSEEGEFEDVIDFYNSINEAALDLKNQSEEDADDTYRAGALLKSVIDNYRTRANFARTAENERRQLEQSHQNAVSAIRQKIADSKPLTSVFERAKTYLVDSVMAAHGGRSESNYVTGAELNLISVANKMMTLPSTALNAKTGRGGTSFFDRNPTVKQYYIRHGIETYLLNTPLKELLAKLVYFYSPEELDIRNTSTGPVDLRLDETIVALVEDENGTVTLELKGELKKFLPIGLLPRSYDGNIESTKGRFYHRDNAPGTRRSLWIRDAVDTNNRGRILTFRNEDGTLSDTPIISNVNKVIANARGLSQKGTPRPWADVDRENASIEDLEEYKTTTAKRTSTRAHAKGRRRFLSNLFLNPAKVTHNFYVPGLRVAVTRPSNLEVSDGTRVIVAEPKNTTSPHTGKSLLQTLLEFFMNPNNEDTLRAVYDDTGRAGFNSRLLKIGKNLLEFFKDKSKFDSDNLVRRYAEDDASYQKRLLQAANLILGLFGGKDGLYIDPNRYQFTLEYQGARLDGKEMFALSLIDKKLIISGPRGRSFRKYALGSVTTGTMSNKTAANIIANVLMDGGSLNGNNSSTYLQLRDGIKWQWSSSELSNLTKGRDRNAPNVRAAEDYMGRAYDDGLVMTENATTAVEVSLIELSAPFTVDGKRQAIWVPTSRQYQLPNTGTNAPINAGTVEMRFAPLTPLNSAIPLGRVEAEELGELIQNESADWSLTDDLKFYTDSKKQGSRYARVTSVYPADVSYTGEAFREGDTVEPIHGELKYKYQSLKEIFYRDGDTEYRQLASYLFDLCTKIGVDVQVVDLLDVAEGEVGGIFDYKSGIIKINKRIRDIAQRNGVTASSIILHETIHAVTSYAIDAVNSGNHDLLSKKAIKAVYAIKACYNQLIAEHKGEMAMLEGKLDGAPGFTDLTYGLKNEKEMIAELANPQFRKVLRKRKLLNKVVNAINTILNAFGVEPILFNGEKTLEDVLLNSLYTIANEFDRDAFYTSNETRYGLHIASQMTSANVNALLFNLIKDARTLMVLDRRNAITTIAVDTELTHYLQLQGYVEGSIVKAKLNDPRNPDDPRFELFKILKIENGQMTISVASNTHKNLAIELLKSKNLGVGELLNTFKKNEWITPSTNIGTGVDEFVRDFFTITNRTDIFANVKARTPEELDKAFNELYGEGRPNATREMWRQLFDLLIKFKYEYCDGRGLHVLPRDVVAHGTAMVTSSDGHKGKLNVAGTLDLLLYDDEGYFYVFDMKTSRASSVEGDFLESKYHSKMAHKVPKYSRLLSFYKALLTLWVKSLYDRNIQFKELGIVPIKTAYPWPEISEGGVQYKLGKGNQILYRESEDQEYQEFMSAHLELGDPITTRDFIEYTERGVTKRESVLDRSSQINIEYNKLSDDYKELVEWEDPSYNPGIILPSQYSDTLKSLFEESIMDLIDNPEPVQDNTTALLDDLDSLLDDSEYNEDSFDDDARIFGIIGGKKSYISSKNFTPNKSAANFAHSTKIRTSKIYLELRDPEGYEVARKYMESQGKESSWEELSDMEKIAFLHCLR